MVKIESNSFFTTTFTSQIGEANSSLENISCAVFANGTTVSGQQKAEESIVESTRLIKVFSTALQEDLGNINRVAEAFHQVDNMLKLNTIKVTK